MLADTLRHFRKRSFLPLNIVCHGNSDRNKNDYNRFSAICALNPGKDNILLFLIFSFPISIRDFADFI